MRRFLRRETDDRRDYPHLQDEAPSYVDLAVRYAERLPKSVSYISLDATQPIVQCVQHALATLEEARDDFDS